SQGHFDALQVEMRGAVLLKNTGLLPLAHLGGRIAVVGDVTVQNTCRDLAAELGRSIGAPSSCTSPMLKLQQHIVFQHQPVAHNGAQRTATFRPTSGGPYLVAMSTYGDTMLTINGAVVVVSHGLAEYSVQRTALV